MFPPGRVGQGLRSNAAPLAFVTIIWIALSGCLLDLVHANAVDFPYYDEWEMVPSLVGAQRVTLKWLWSQHNEHRIFLPRLIYLAVTKLGGCDFRVGMYFDTITLIVAAAAVLIAARKMRGGRTEFSDAFLAFVLLNAGQAQNLVNSFQIALVAGTLVAVTALWFILDHGRLGFRGAVTLGVCTILFPLMGGHGLAFVPALSAAVFLTGWGLRTDGGGKWRMAVVWALGGLGLALLAFYFVDYHRPAKHPTSPGLSFTLNGAIQFLTNGLGPAAHLAWPQSRIILLALAVATVAALGFLLYARPAERPRTLRLLCFLGGTTSLALGIGWARAALSPEAMFESRYATLAAPFWLAVYFIWELVDLRQLRRFVHASLLFFAAALVISNYQGGVREAAASRDWRRGPMADLEAGTPLNVLVARHYGVMYYAGPEILGQRMRMLHDRGVGVFKKLHL